MHTITELSIIPDFGDLRFPFPLVRPPISIRFGWQIVPWTITGKVVFVCRDVCFEVPTYKRPVPNSRCRFPNRNWHNTAHVESAITTSLPRGGTGPFLSLSAFRTILTALYCLHVPPSMSSWSIFVFSEPRESTEWWTSGSAEAEPACAKSKLGTWVVE